MNEKLILVMVVVVSLIALLFSMVAPCFSLGNGLVYGGF